MASMDFYRANSSATSRWKHDVFLSFRGEDTRDNFVSHLHTALIQKAILTYKDDVKLETGEEISPQLLKAIQESRFSVVVLSENYASSRWCLDELVEILECRSNTTAVSVYPVFYYVDPSDVRKQTGRFGDGFAESVSKQGGILGMEDEKVQKWKKALEQVANLAGWHYPSDSIVRSESRFIQDFVKKIFEKLTHAYLSVSEDLVGMPSRMEKVIKLLGLGMDDTRFVGICGMGGMGKTTIARAIYARFSCQFEGCSFIENVREVSERGDLKTLQQQLISEILMEKDLKVGNVGSAVSTIENMVCRKKVLIVLDDVDDSTELENFVGKHHQFAFGSRIIITTRDEHVLTRYGITHVYKVEELRQDEAIKLFKLKAFGKAEQKAGYGQLVNHAVEYAEGVPLALKVLGSHLCGRDKDAWKSSLNRLKKSPLKEVEEVIRVSFDALQFEEKEIFLDIACFFKGKDKKDVTKILEGCDFNPTIGIAVLHERSLVTTSDNKLMMHDLIQEVGWSIVREESPKEPGERSRLWLYEDMTHALMENTETKKVEGILVRDPGLRNRDPKHFVLKQLRPKVFLNMPNLRILRICCMHLSEDLKYLSNKLSYLDWCGYPMKYMPSTFQPKHLVELHLTHGSIEQLWEGTMDNLDMLRILNLSHSIYLTKSPDFTRVPKLERLILEGCTGLVNLHPSIGILRRLIFLNLKDCKNLKSLPSGIQLKSLEVLIISGCSKLKNISFNFGYMKCLSELYLDGIGVIELPPSVGHLTNLSVMNLSNCKNLRSIPGSICQLKALRSLNLSGCSKLDKLPQEVGALDCLEELRADCTAIRQLPSSIGLLKKLKILTLGGCKGITSNSWSSFFWHSILRRQRESSMTLELTALLELQSLEELDFEDCNLNSIPTAICHINSLRILNLSGNNFESLPASMSQLSKLVLLCLDDCKWLQEIPELSSKITNIQANDCTSLKTILSPSIYEYVREFSFRNCFKLLENKQNNIITENFCSILSAQKNRWRWRFPADLVIPGSEIPKWFSHQSMGSSVSFELPPNWYNRSLVGIAIAVVDQRYTYMYTLDFSSIVLEFKRLGTQFISRYHGGFLTCFPNGYSGHIMVMYVPLTNIPRSMEDDMEELNTGGIELQVCLVRTHDFSWRVFYYRVLDWEEFPFIEDVKLGVRLIYMEGQPRSIDSSDSEDLDNSDSDSEEVEVANLHQIKRRRTTSTSTSTAKGPIESGKKCETTIGEYRDQILAQCGKLIPTRVDD